MTVATTGTLEHAVHVANQWLDELCGELGRDDRRHAYRVLRASLIALRDRLTVEEATDLGAQLPTIIRGVYYEGWNPAKTPTRQRSKDQFLERVAQLFTPRPEGSVEDSVRAVFRVLGEHVTLGEIEDVEANLPEGVRDLWI